MMMSRSGPCSVVDGASEDFIEEANEMRELADNTPVYLWIHSS